MLTAALIVAAGSGQRAGGDLPKQYRTVGGRTVLARTASAFLAAPDVELVQVVIGAGHEDLYEDATAGLALPAPVTGGATRQASVRLGLEALSARGVERVLIHDAARPFVGPALISRVVGALGSHEAVLPAVAVADTLKRVDGGGTVSATVDRTGLWAAQTPQGFRFEAILKAHARAHGEGRSDFTDDSALAEWAGIPVHVVEGEPANMKLTTNADLEAAGRQLDAQDWLRRGDVRTGQGFDVHAFAPGDHVILCGVTIPHEARLSGHSDADVGMHALTDAILGAVGAGDIGAHFPPSDPQWKGAASDIFLKAACDLIAERDGLIAHADVTLICEAPKIRPHVEAMRETLARIMGIDAARVSVKATTSEQLGFTGRREGIAALAAATVRLPFA